MITEQHVPQFRFKGFSDSWEQRKFSELFQKSSEKNTNLSFSRSQVLTGATMTDSDRDINSDDDYMKTYNVIHVGDILFEGHTSKQFAFGRFVLDDYRDGIVSHVFDIYRPKAKMNLSFWKYYIHDENVMRPILVRATSNARMLNALSSSEFLKQSVFVPSENEQAKIGNLLEQIDSTIALHQRKLELLKRLKQGYLQKLFPQNGENVPELRFKGYSDAWEKRKLGELANIRRGASPRPIKSKKWFSQTSQVGWIRISDVTEQNGRIHQVEQHLSDAGQKKTLVLKSKHLLLSIAATVGKPVQNYIQVGVHDGFIVFMDPKFDLDFMFYFLEKYRPNWARFGQPGSQININSELVRDLVVSIPTVHEQDAVAQFIITLDNLIAATQHKVDLLKKLKKGYLQKMFC
ncbi:restriction endonuclease subunit S [Liquorilactobacillus satsumensis]|uniref:restriction endonuclease subunit S n=1 Tax=Liquorilactobacillus satsumensis TaxID=259059 RepID=UPI0039EB51B7